MKLLHTIIAIIATIYSTNNIFTVDIFSGIQSLILFSTVVYVVYVYSVYYSKG